MLIGHFQRRKINIQDIEKGNDWNFIKGVPYEFSVFFNVKICDLRDFFIYSRSFYQNNIKTCQINDLVIQYHVVYNHLMTRREQYGEKGKNTAV